MLWCERQPVLQVQRFRVGWGGCSVNSESGVSLAEVQGVNIVLEFQSTPLHEEEVLGFHSMCQMVSVVWVRCVGHEVQPRHEDGKR